MEVMLFWFLFSILCGVMASTRGRSGFGYFILALLITPIITFLLLLIIGRKAPPESEAPPAIEETRIPCPHCAELVLAAAKVCKHCGRDIPQPEQTA